MARTKTALDIEDFSYLPQTDLPALILGIHIPSEAFRAESNRAVSYRFKKGKKWEKIAHEAFGTQHYWIGTRLYPSAETQFDLGRFLHEWVDWELEPITVDTITTYRAALNRNARMDCNHSFTLLSSNHFPVDVETVLNLVGEGLPPVDQLDDLVDWDSGLQRAAGSAGRWNAVILA